MLDPVHRIRLRPPWDERPVDRPSGRRLARRFGKPTGVEARQRIWLVIEASLEALREPSDDAACVERRAVAVWLNARPLGELSPESPGRWDVTGALESRNELWLDLPDASGASSGDGGPIGPPSWIREVRLEIAGG